MTYRRPYKPRRRPAFRRYRRKGQVKTMKRVAQGVINRNLEKKYIDLLYNAAVSTSGALTDMCQISIGTGDAATRIGDKIRILSLKFRLQIYMVPTTNDTTNWMRFILFQWHPASVPTVTSILNTASIYAFYQHDLGSNYSVWFDKTYNLTNGGVMTRSLNWTFRFGRKAGKMKWVTPNIKFTSGNNDGNDHLYLLVLSDSSAAPDPVYVGNSRMTYTDG